jgi:hypothetical protein
MGISNFIVVESKTTQMVVDKINCDHLDTNQMCYKAEKLVDKYPDDEYVIYLEMINDK